MTKNREQPNIPYQQVLNCDRYNQACAGGYPFLVEKYAQDFGLTKSGQCAKSEEELKELGEGAQANDAYVRVKNFGYIGGYYGGTNTKQMMTEIYKNGPIVVGINGGYELMHYESGLFIETGEGEGKVLNDFERVDHAVLVVGWGKSGDGKKHWIIKNSYGAAWGEHGYFRMPLAGDTHGITSLTSAAIPVLGDSGYFNTPEQKVIDKTTKTLVEEVLTWETPQ
jgi:cathepsin C